MLVLLLVSCLLFEVDSTKYETSPLFLHQNIKVLQYDLEITPFYLLWNAEPMTFMPAENAFTGQVQITINVMAPSSSIILHAADTMYLNRIIISDSSDDVEYDSEELNTLRNSTVVLRHSFNAQKYVITIYYNNIIRNDREGFYRVQPRNTETITNKLRNGTYLTTQFEANYARELMPCFDQPNMKAYFRLRINHPKGTTAISNTDPTHIEDCPYEDIEDYTSTLFQRTPLMSTYLLAVTIGEFESFETVANDGMILRVLGEKTHMIDNEDAYELALNITKDAYEFCSEYFDFPLPIQKIDGVFVETSSGGMENFGLINYNINNLKRKDDYTVWHEIIHQWMGNTITAHWWRDLCINEGFTTFLTDKFLKVKNTASYYKGKIRLSPRTEKEYRTVFENAYLPAGNVITMIEKLYGEKRIHNFIKAMVQNFAFKNADFDDVLALLPYTKHSKYIYDCVHSFMDQTGAPELHITADGNMYHFTQTTIREKDALENIDTKYKSRFTIPIFYKVNGEDQVKWFPYQETTVTIPIMQNDTLVFEENNINYLISFH